MSTANLSAPWTKAMKAFLADGEWHPVEEVVRVGMREVPPNRAAAFFHSYIASRRKGRAPDRNKSTTPAEIVADGKWHLCRKALMEWKRRGQLEVDPPQWKAPNKRVRWVDRHRQE